MGAGSDMTQDLPRKALFLDRDGVINVDLGYVHTPERTEWVPGIFDLCRTAHGLGYMLVVVTNQAGIARGFYSEQVFKDYSEWQRLQFLARGLEIAGAYHCPHHPEYGMGALRRECGCRKPAPGMLLRADRELGINMTRSVLIGDKKSDVEAGHNAGLKHCYLLQGPGPAPHADDSMKDAERWLRSLEVG